MTKKLNAHAITPELLLYQVGTDSHRKARWSYRITLKGAKDLKPVERLISSHFAYSEYHWGRTNQLLPVDRPPPEDIVNYAMRILHAYREQWGRTGTLVLREPTLLSLVSHYASESDKRLVERHIEAPADRSQRDPRTGHVMLVDLDKVTHLHLKLWTQKFDDHEPRVRAILKGVLLRAYEAGDIRAIPAII